MGLVYLSIYAVAAPVFSAGLIEAAGVATAITLGPLLLLIVKLRQMDREKANWHFAALHEPRLELEATLAVAREILTRRGYAWEERTRRTRTLFITYLDLKAHRISMRVWFSTLMTPPVVEIGFGPEDAVNRERLRDLRSATTEEFVRRYGTAT